jgi:iron complex transport system substrate-binding protein
MMAIPRLNLLRSCFAGLLLLSSAAFARDFKDATGASVSVPDHPSRIVTLAPSVGELAAEFLGADLERIVGVSDATDYPPALKNSEAIGPYHRFNLEKILALKPDLVLATLEGNSKDQVLHLRELGLQVFVFSTGSFSDVEASMRQMAELLGEPKKGDVVVERFEKSLQQIRARGREHAKTPKRVLIQLDEQPLVVAGGPSFLSEALKTVGAENIYAGSKAGYPRPSIEDVLKRNPDFVLVIAFGPELRRFNIMAARWSQHPDLLATQKKQLKVVYADALLRPSMRLLEGLAVLERTLYGQP